MPTGFKLSTDERGGKSQEQTESKLMAMRRQIEERRKFKAMPLPDFEKKSFQVKPSEKPLTQSQRPVFLGDFVKAKKPVELPKKEPTVPGKPEWEF